MKHQGPTFFDKAADIFFKFAKDYLPKAGTNAAIAATPLLAAAAVSGASYIAAMITRDPAALEAAYFSINNPDSSMWMTALKGNLPFEAANHAYQFATVAFATGLAAAGLTKVVEKFGSLREEADHLRKENQLLKSEFANERATNSADGRPTHSLRSRLDAGISNMQSRLEQPEQATRVTKGPSAR